MKSTITTIKKFTFVCLILTVVLIVNGCDIRTELKGQDQLNAYIEYVMFVCDEDKWSNVTVTVLKSSKSDVFIEEKNLYNEKYYRCLLCALMKEKPQGIICYEYSANCIGVEIDYDYKEPHTIEGINMKHIWINYTYPKYRDDKKNEKQDRIVLTWWNDDKEFRVEIKRNVTG